MDEKNYSELEKVVQKLFYALNMEIPTVSLHLIQTTLQIMKFNYKFAFDETFLERLFKTFHYLDFKGLSTLEESVETMFDMIHDHYFYIGNIENINVVAEKFSKYLFWASMESLKQPQNVQLKLVDIVCKFGSSKIATEVELINCSMIGIIYAMKVESKVCKEAISSTQCLFALHNINSMDFFGWYEQILLEFIINIMVSNYNGYSINANDSLKNVNT